MTISIKIGQVHHSVLIASILRPFRDKHVKMHVCMAFSILVFYDLRRFSVGEKSRQLKPFTLSRTPV